MRLLLVRHGEGEGQSGRAVGHADLPLSEPGRRSIAALAERIDERPGRLVSSDLARARDSAAILAARWGVAVETDARLRELDFGDWDNRTWQQLEAEDSRRLAEWMADWTRVPAPGGESFTELAGRVGEWLVEWRKACLTMSGPTLVVAHAGSIRAILCLVRGLPLGRAFEFPVDHASLTEVLVEEA